MKNRSSQKSKRDRQINENETKHIDDQLTQNGIELSRDLCNTETAYRKTEQYGSIVYAFDAGVCL